MAPLVSVIVPVYNAQQTLGRCVNSILSQTFRDLELILVDDGSTDDSLQICRNWAALDGRVRVIRQDNGGVSRARNRGLAEARGTYVQFADADDWVAPEMTGELLRALRAHQADVAVCSCWQVDAGDETKRAKLGLYEDGAALVLDRDGIWNEMLRLVWDTSSMESPWNKLYVRDIIEKVGLQFPLDLSLGEDFVFNLAYFRHCGGLVFLPQPLYFYCVAQDGKTLTSRPRPDFLQTMCRVEEELLTAVREHHALSRQEEQIFARHFSSRICVGFLHVSRRCEEEEAIGRIAQILRCEQVRRAFADTQDPLPQYAAFLPLVAQADAEAIYDECARRFGPAPHPGFANRALSAALRSLEHVPPLRRWAHKTRRRLAAVGVRAVLCARPGGGR